MKTQKQLEQLQKENTLLREKLEQSEKEYNILFNDWRIDQIANADECYRCTCGKVSECNCYHLGLRLPKVSN